MAARAADDARARANCFVENPREGEIANADVGGARGGRLRGLRVAVKDNVAVRGLRAGAEEAAQQRRADNAARDRVARRDVRL